MERTYAQALWQMIEKGMEPVKAVHAIHAQLKAQGRSALMPRIARAFERHAAHEHARNAVTLTVAHTKDVAHAQQEAVGVMGTIAPSAMVPMTPLEIHVDHTLIGGWRIEGRETLVDASYKKHLLAIYNLATHS